MMGHRGCRLAISYPEIAEMQTTAVTVSYTHLDVYKRQGLFSFGQLFLLLLGTFVAFVVSLFAIKALLNYVKTVSYTHLKWYVDCL